MIFSNITEREVAPGHTILVFKLQNQHDEYFRDLVMAKLKGDHWNPHGRGILYTIKSRILPSSRGKTNCWSSKILINTTLTSLWQCTSGFTNSHDAIMAAKRILPAAIDANRR